MNLSIGATQSDFEICKNIVLEYVKEQEADELAIELLKLVYSKGGDYSEKTLRAFAKPFFKK